MTKIRENALDAQYVGRAVQIVQEQMADAVQICITPTGVDLDLFRKNSLQRAQAMAHKIFSETFREDVEL
jgi:hypothetical protein